MWRWRVPHLENSGALRPGQSWRFSYICATSHGREFLMFLTSMAPQNILIVMQPLEECCYCWHLLHTQQSYPEKWSSTICREHSAWIQRQAADRRERLALATAERRLAP